MKRLSFRIMLMLLLLLMVIFSTILNAGINFDAAKAVKYDSLGTPVGGYISENTTWTLEGSPYIVVADVIVERDVSLTIEPGVVVKFATGANLVIDGGIIADGNSTHPIIFTSNATTPAPGDWGTIKFRYRSNDNVSVISWAIISYATDAVTVESSSPKIQNSRIEHNIVGVRIRQTWEDDFPMPLIQNCVISENVGREIDPRIGKEGGISIDLEIFTPWFPSPSKGWVYVKNSYIENNNGCGITTKEFLTQTFISVTGTVIQNNKGHGVCGREITIENSIIRNNSGDGLRGTRSGIIKVKDSIIANNSGCGVGGIYLEPTVVLIRSIVSDNFGAGIYVAVINITNSEITGNRGSGIACNEGSIHYSKIFGNYFDIENVGIYDINATLNWWGTTNETLIEEHIYDYYDDYNLGRVIYKPYLVPPIANFTFTPETPYAYGTVTFDASASFNSYGSIMNYTWDFDDGNITTTTLPVITHIFTTPGNYNVTLTVTDEFGLTNSMSTMVTVLEDDIPPVTTDDYDGMWRNADFTITLTAIDHESGVAETYYRINDGPIKAVTVDGYPLITTEGSNNTLEYWSVDRAGNEELPHKILTGIKLDKTAPSVVHVLRVPEDNVEPEQDVKVSVNVTDLLSGIQNVVLSYTLDYGTSWNNLTMTYNSTNGLYETTIKVQQANVQVKYKIIAYDNAGNCRVEDNNGQYYVYIVIPEFPSIIIILLLMLTILITTLLKKKGTTKFLNLIFSKF